MEIKTSFINLGTYRDQETGDILPILPKNNSALKVVDLKTVWCYQVKMDKNAAKGTSGMIFPFDYQHFYDIKYIKENKLCNNGTIFIDIDCGEELVETVMNAIPELNQRLGFPILGAAMTKKGIHILVRSNYYTYEEFSRPVFYYLTAIAWVLKDITGIDLRSIDGALDACTFSMKQRFFLRYSKKIYWEDNAQIVIFPKPTREKLKEEYEFLWKKKIENNVWNKYREEQSQHVKIIQTGKIEKIIDPGTQDYIEHRGDNSRWTLFNSLCCCFPDEKTVNKQWKRCAKLIAPTKHDEEFFLKEPEKNGWYEKWCNKTTKYCNYELLERFGYVFKDGSKNSKVIPMPQNIDDLL